MNLYSSAKKPIRLVAPDVYEIWKERAETLAVLLKRFKKENEIDENQPVTYAGRLDPMAEGIVVMLVGDAVYEKEKFSGLDKTYTFTILLGISTDTYDVLGTITNNQIPIIKRITKEDIEKVVEKIKTKQLPYPLYSSKPVDGKPLFIHAREGNTPENIPLQRGKIREIDLEKIEQISLSEIATDIINDIKKVRGDFRQGEILESWKQLVAEHPDTQVTITTLEATVESGVYIRSIAHEIGKELGVGAIAYSIARSTVAYN